MSYGKISKKQSEILEYIKNEILNRGFPPSVREICEAVNLKPVFRCSTRKFPAFLFSLFSFLLPPLDFSLIYNKFLMPFRGFFYWKNFFDTL